MEYLIKILSKGDLESALDEIEKLCKSKNQINNYVLLSGRYSSLEKQYFNGILTQSEYHISRNKIIHSALNLLDELDIKTETNKTENKSFMSEERKLPINRIMNLRRSLQDSNPFLERVKKLIERSDLWKQGYALNGETHDPNSDEYYAIHLELSNILMDINNQKIEEEANQINEMKSLWRTGDNENLAKVCDTLHIMYPGDEWDTMGEFFRDNPDTMPRIKSMFSSQISQVLKI